MDIRWHLAPRAEEQFPFHLELSGASASGCFAVSMAALCQDEDFTRLDFLGLGLTMDLQPDGSVRGIIGLDTKLRGARTALPAFQHIVVAHIQMYPDPNRQEPDSALDFRTLSANGTILHDPATRGLHILAVKNLSELPALLRQDSKLRQRRKKIIITLTITISLLIALSVVFLFPGNAPAAPPLIEQAQGAWQLKDWSAAERLALQAAEEFRDGGPPSVEGVITAYQLAGRAALARGAAPAAAEHLSKAIELTSREKDPLKWARLNHDLASALMAQAHADDAIKMLRTVCRIKAEQLGDEDKDTVTSRGNLANAFQLAGRSADAETTYLALLPITEKWSGEDHKNHLTLLHDLGRAQTAQRKFAKAMRNYEAVLKERIALLGEEDSETLKTKTAMAEIFAAQEQWEAAENLQIEVLNVRKRINQPEDPLQLLARFALATTHWKQGQVVAAEEEFREIKEIQAKILGPSHPCTLASRMNWANCLSDLGRLKEAYAEHHEVNRLRKTSGIGTPKEYAGGLLAEAGAASRLGKSREALGLYEEAEASLKSLAKPEVELELSSRLGIAFTLMNLHRNSEAEAAMDALIPELEKQFGPNHVMTAGAWHNRALLYKDQGRYAEAETILRQVINRGGNASKESRREKLACVADLANVLAEQHKLTEAERLYQEVLDKYEQDFGPSHLDTLTVKDAYAGYQLYRGDYKAAAGTYRAVIDAANANGMADSELALQSRGNLAAALWKSGDNVQAEKEIRTLLARYKELRRPETDTRVLSARRNLAEFLRSQGNYPAAKAEVESVLSSLHSVGLPPDDPHIILCRGRLALIMENLGRYAESEKELEQILPLCTSDVQRDKLRAQLAGVRMNLGPEGALQAVREFEDLIATRKQRLGASHPETLGLRARHARLLQDLSRYPEAEREFEEIADLWKGRDPDGINTFWARSNLACVWRLRGDAEKAEKEHAALLDRVTKQPTPDPALVLELRKKLAADQLERENFRDARAQYDQVISLLEAYDVNSPDIIDARLNRSTALVGLHEFKAAEEDIRKVIRSYAERGQTKETAYFVARNVLASCLEEQGRLAEAETERKENVMAARVVLGAKHEHTLGYIFNYAFCLAKEKKFEEAAGPAREALEGHREVLGPTHWKTENAQRLWDELQKVLPKTQ